MDESSFDIARSPYDRGDEHDKNFEPDLEDGLMDNEETKLLPDVRIRHPRTRGNGHQVPRRGFFTYEESLTAIGSGRFHAVLVLLCGWAVSSDSVEILSLSFLLPAATCDLHLTSVDKGWLNAMVFVGMLVGGYFWGMLADSWGRRSILIWSLTINGMGCLLSSVAQVYWLFLLFRFISGIGVGGSLPVVFTYFTEFQAKERRGAMISVLATFWMAGNTLAAALAWIIIPQESWGYYSPDFTFDSWRIFVAVCTIPSLSSAAIFVLMPESPKFLLKMGKEVQAISILKRVHKTNRSQTPFEISRLVIANDETDEMVQSAVGVDANDETKPLNGNLKSYLASTVELFRGPLLKSTLILLVVNFAIYFGYYGLFMWFPELFNRIDQNGGTICDPGDASNQTTSNETTSDCEVVGEIVYVEGFLTALANLPGNLLTIVLMDRVGRKVLLASSMVISGLSVFLLWFVHKRWQDIVMSCIFSAVSTIGFSALDVLQSEIFPTHCRSTAFGLQSSIGRVGAILGNLVFGMLVDVHCSIPMILVASLLAFGGLISIKLPNTTGVDIH